MMTQLRHTQDNLGNVTSYSWVVPTGTGRALKGSMPLPTRLVAWAAAIVLAGASCSSEQGGAPSAGGGNAGSSGEEEPSGALMVFAAASLTDAFEDLESEFEAIYPKVDVKLNFAGRLCTL